MTFSFFGKMVPLKAPPLPVPPLPHSGTNLSLKTGKFHHSKIQPSGLLPYKLFLKKRRKLDHLESFWKSKITQVHLLHLIFSKMVSRLTGNFPSRILLKKQPKQFSSELRLSGPFSLYFLLPPSQQVFVWWLLRQANRQKIYSFLAFPRVRFPM